MMANVEEFRVPRNSKVLAGIIGLLVLLTMAALGWGLVTEEPPHQSTELIALTVTLVALGGFGGFMVYRGFLAPDRSFLLSELGAEGPDGAGDRSFVPWDRMHGLKVRRFLRRLEILDVGGEPLLRVGTDIPEFGRLMQALLVRGLLPRRRTAIPLRLEPDSDKQLGARIFSIVVGLGLIALATVSRESLYFAVGVAVVIGLLALVSRRFATKGIEIRRDGIAVLKGETWTVREWPKIEGVGVMVQYAQKGQRFLLLGLKPIAGDWIQVPLAADQWVEFLSGVHSVDPARIIPTPDGLMLALGFSSDRKFVARKGLSKLTWWI